MQKFDVVNWNINSQPIPSIFNEGYSQYETLSKLLYQINQFIENMNLAKEEIDDLEEKKLAIVDYLNDIKNNRKLNEVGDFTGTWHGLEMQETEQGLSTDWNNAKGTFTTVTERLNYSDLVLNESKTHIDYLTIVPKKLNGETTDTPSINRALTTLLSNGGGTLFFDKLEYEINEPIIIYSDICYRGRGKMTTQIKLADGANCDIFKSVNFEELSTIYNGGVYPSNYYDILPQRFSIFDLYIYGNYIDYDENGSMLIEGDFYKHNNVTGYGLKIFGRNYEIDRIRIENVAEVGAYFECDSSETANISLQCTLSGYEGLIYRGSPDSSLDRINIGKSGYHAVKNDGTIDALRNISNIYSGSAIDSVVIDKTCEINELHTWGCETGFGIRVKHGHRIKARHIMSESNLNGAYLDDSRFQIGILDLHNNRNITIQSEGNNGKQIDNLEIIWDKQPSDYGLSGWGNTIIINGNNHVISGIIKDGSNCDGDCITMSGYNNNINMLVRNYVDSNVFVYNGGSRNKVELITENCKNVVKLLSSVSIGNIFKITSQAKQSTSQTLFDLGSYALNMSNNEYLIYWQQVDDSGTQVALKTTKQRITSANTISLDTTTVQNIDVSHNFITTPSSNNINLLIGSSASTTDYVIAYVKPTVIDSTKVTVQVKLSVASATVGAKGSILMKID